MMRFMFRVILAALLTIATARSAQAAITWNVTYNDVVNNTNMGFDDATLGATRQATFEAALGYISSVITDTGTADLRINNSINQPGGYLASAGALMWTTPNRFENGFVFEHVTTGSDPTGSHPDANATFNFFYNWNSGTGAPGASQYDLYSVALHEVSHMMGFSSYVNSDGTSGISGGDPGVFSVYDSFLELGDGTALFGGAGDFLGTAADLISSDVFFDGPNATAANGGNPVKVYSPNPFNPGSSIAHIQLGGDEIMQYSIGTGVERRTYNAIEMGILQDIGWSVSTIPEPSSIVALAGMGIIGLIGYRLRRKELAA